MTKVFEKIRDEKQMMSLTGMGFEEFGALLPYFEQGYRMRVGALGERARRHTPPVFTDYREVLLLTLMKSRRGMTHMELAFEFGIGRSTAEKYEKAGARALEVAMKLAGSLPCRDASGKKSPVAR